MRFSSENPNSPPKWLITILPQPFASSQRLQLTADCPIFFRKLSPTEIIKTVFLRLLLPSTHSAHSSRPPVTGWGYPGPSSTTQGLFTLSSSKPRTRLWTIFQIQAFMGLSLSESCSSTDCRTTSRWPLLSYRSYRFQSFPQSEKPYLIRPHCYMQATAVTLLGFSSLRHRLRLRCRPFRADPSSILYQHCCQCCRYPRDPAATGSIVPVIGTINLYDVCNPYRVSKR